MLDAEISPDARRSFTRLLLNTLVANTAATFVWFSLTFWVYNETRSVTATAMIGAAFSLVTALLGVPAGSFVDRHRRTTSIRLSTTICLVCFIGASSLYAAVGGDEILRMRGPWFWPFISVTLVGCVASQMRAIALSTCVTLLVPSAERDRANGLVGTINGISFALTSVFSGLAIYGLGMGWAYAVAVVVIAVVLVDVFTLRIPGDEPSPRAEHAPRVDFRGALAAIHTVPGLMMLILFAAFNNIVGGVFMSLMDAYGLELVSVRTWGILWGVLSLFFIAGGVVVARKGVGPSPLKAILYANLVNWVACSVFTLRSSIVLLAIGCAVWLALIPLIEAAEQTVLQQSIPFEMQGRVFGFAQTVETMATPIMAIGIGPLTETLIIPFMTDGRGAEWIGGWFGTGQSRGIALAFTVSGILGIVVTLVARASKSYRRLSTPLTPIIDVAG